MGCQYCGCHGKSANNYFWHFFDTVIDIAKKSQQVFN